MSEHQIRGLVEDVNAGRLSRRAFVRLLVGSGVSAFLASRILTEAGIAHAQTRPAATTAKRGGGGQFKALWWDAPNLLNPILAVGLKD